MKTAAIIGWSGYGDLDDLRRTASGRLGITKSILTPAPHGLTVDDTDPVRVARRLHGLPGVDWVAVGFSFENPTQATRALQRLATRYLAPGSTFRLSVSAEESDQEEGDVLLDNTGVILKSVNGTKVDERSPQTTFRVVMVKNRGVAGVQLAEGPGGVPTSSRSPLYCLVSGGYHSAVAAWMAALSGYAITLVHARTRDEEALRQVARLYAELSHRLDPRGLELQLIEGDGRPEERLASWLRRTSGDKVAGSHPECRGRAARSAFRRAPEVILPLLLVQETEVRSKYDSLGLRLRHALDDRPSMEALAADASRDADRGPNYRVRRFGGRESDINGVLDGILRSG